MYIIFILLVSVLLTTNARAELRENISSQAIKTSVIIPCCHAHASYLFRLLTRLEKQTVLPNQVVISLSEARKLPSHIKKALRNKKWKFQLKLIENSEKLSAGENRNIACKHASGDVLICQDADDIPHPQRIEIISYFFKKYNIDHLMHAYFEIQEAQCALFDSYADLTTIKMHPYHSHAELDPLGIFTHGNVAITRQTFNKIKWDNKRIGEDTDFNKKALELLENCVAIAIPLLAYRRFLSSSIYPN